MKVKLNLVLLFLFTSSLSYSQGLEKSIVKDFLSSPVDSIWYFKHKEVELHFIDSIRIFYKNGITSGIRTPNEESKKVTEENIAFEDFNFDGFDDAKVMNWNGGQGIQSYNAFLFIPESKSFMYSEELSDLPGLFVDPAKKLIISTARAGKHDGFYLQYKYIDGQLKALSEISDSSFYDNDQFKVRRISKHYLDKAIIMYVDTMNDFTIARDASEFNSICNAADHIGWHWLPFSLSNFVSVSPQTGHSMWITDMEENGVITGVKLELEKNGKIVQTQIIPLTIPFNDKSYLPVQSIAENCRVYEDFAGEIYLLFNTALYYKKKWRRVFILFSLSICLEQ